MPAIASLSLCLRLCLSVSVSVYLSLSLSLCLFFCFCLARCLSACFSVSSLCLSLSLCLCLSMSVSLCLCLAVSLSISLSLSLCLSVSVSSPRRVYDGASQTAVTAICRHSHHRSRCPWQSAAASLVWTSSAVEARATAVTWKSTMACSALARRRPAVRSFGRAASVEMWENGGGGKYGLLLTFSRLALDSRYGRSHNCPTSAANGAASLLRNTETVASSGPAPQCCRCRCRCRL